MKKGGIIGGIIAVLLLIGAIVFCAWVAPKLNEKLAENTYEPPNNQEAKSTSEENTIHLTLGNPSNAKANPSAKNNYLLTNKYFALSYDKDRGIANWVAWQLSKKDMSKVPRQNDFRPDERLPANWKKVFASYYKRSGYSRGHIVPSADRTSSVEANSATFVMSNMAPQTHDLNTGPWEKLERYSRSLARRKNDLFLYSGCYGEKKRLRRTVSVPTNCWKIIVVVRKGWKISDETRIIAVDMPNVEGIKERNWRDYKTSIKNIEGNTGYDFLNLLPNDLQESLETKVDSR